MLRKIMIGLCGCKVALSCAASIIAPMRRAVAQRLETRPGPLEIILTNRAFTVPDRIVGGLTIQPAIGLAWSPMSGTRLRLEAQTVDNAGPGKQGRYRASRVPSPGGSSGNFLQELTVGAGVRLWHAQTLSLEADGALSRGKRSYTIIDSVGQVAAYGNRGSFVPSAAIRLGVTAARASAAVGLASIWLARRDAMYFRALPGETRAFGTVVGPELEGEVWLVSALALWGRAFAPMIGNNTISRASGRPARAAAYDGGLRLRVNPALDAELFGSNALGNSGALAYLADREYGSLGSRVVFRPTARSLGSGAAARDSLLTSPGQAAALMVPGVPRRGEWWARIGGGSHGFLGSTAFAPVDQLELGAFLDYPRGLIDEGELGATARVTLLAQRSGVPVTLSALAAAARTNNPMVNFLVGRRDELTRLGLAKGGFEFGEENEREGRVYVLVAAMPIERRIDSKTAIRAAPVVAVAQRSGTRVAGFVLGMTRRLATAIDADVSAGLDLANKGNVLTRDGRERAPVWSLSLSWASPAMQSRGLALDGFVTNRVGDSPFHSLRVRADRRPAIGIAVRLSARPRTR